jgi:hypothetical protein
MTANTPIWEQLGMHIGDDPEQLSQGQPDAGMAQAFTAGRPLSSADYYQLIHSQIDNEDNLLNQRFIWLVFSQSFMFSAFATVANAPEKAKAPFFGASQDSLFWLLPVIAIVSTGLIYIGILSSLKSLATLRDHYNQYPQDETVKAYPPMQGSRPSSVVGRLAPMVLPSIFALAWVTIMALQVFHAIRG